MWNWLKKEENRVTRSIPPEEPPTRVYAEIEKNILYMKEKLGASFDILYG